MFWAVDYLCLAFILASAVLVVWLDNLNASVLALSAVGTVLTVVFIVLGAPDDAHCEIVVGAIALPTLYLIAIGKVRTAVRQGEEPALGEKAQREAPSGR
jgi:uncharacterized MnhB-related membrane protein